jgi:hypothetical protein
MPSTAPVGLVAGGFWSRGRHVARWVVGSPWRLRWPLLRLEHELNDLRGFFLRSFKLPFADRICGGFDQRRASPQRPRRLNTPIWPHHNFQLHHSSNVGTSREFRIHRTNFFDRFSSRMAFRLCRAGLGERTRPQCSATIKLPPRRIGKT